MTDRPDLSVLIVNWNGGELVLRVLASLKASAGDLSLQIIVCDNGSTDGSAEAIVRAHPEVELIRAGADLGFVRATNRQLPHVRGRNVLLLNPDAIADGPAVRTLVDFLERHADVGICGPKLLLPDGRMDLACRRRFKTLETYVFRVLLLDRVFPRHPRFGRYNMLDHDPDRLTDVDAISGACMLLRRKVLDDLGWAMDERFHMICEDEDWCCRAKAAGWRIVYNPEAVVWHYKGSSTTRHPSAAERVKTAYHRHRSMWLFHLKHLGPRYGPLTNAFVFGSIATIGTMAALWALRPAARRR